MNRITAWLADKSVELLFAYRTLRTPNPFHAVRGREPWWMEQSPEDFYAVPDTAPRISFHTEWKSKYRTRLRFSFTSAHKSPYPENNTVHGLAALSPERTARAAVIVVHGHRMSSFAGLEWFALPAANEGADIYYISLPYHMQRTPKGTWSGQLVLNSDVEGTAFAFRQGVMDVRSLITWIESSRGTPVGLAGISLGAYTSSMVTVVDPRPKALISIVGGGSLAQIIWDNYMMGRPKRQMMAGGVTRARLETYWKLLGPTNWDSCLSKERVMMLAGKFDTIVTPSNVFRLWQSWGHPRIHWYPSGHGTIATYYREAVGEIRHFLRSNLLSLKG
jgi:pimeloyl-ACP methyl ester carboxylesterase